MRTSVMQREGRKCMRGSRGQRGRAVLSTSQNTWLQNSYPVLLIQLCLIICSWPQGSGRQAHTPDKPLRMCGREHTALVDAAHTPTPRFRHLVIIQDNPDVFFFTTFTRVTQRTLGIREAGELQGRIGLAKGAISLAA